MLPLIDAACGIAGEIEQMPRIGPDEMTHGVEDRAEGAGDGCLQLFGGERQARIDHAQGCPHVVAEREFHRGSAHVLTVATRAPVDPTST